MSRTTPSTSARRGVASRYAAQREQDAQGVQELRAGADQLQMLEGYGQERRDQEAQAEAVGDQDERREAGDDQGGQDRSCGIADDLDDNDLGVGERRLGAALAEAAEVEGFQGVVEEAEDHDQELL